MLLFDDKTTSEGRSVNMVIKFSTVSFFAIGIPVFLGLIFADVVKISDLFANAVASPALEPTATPTTTAPEICKERFEVLFRSETDPFEKISLVLHQNGEPTSCGATGSGSDFYKLVFQNYVGLREGFCPSTLSKYQVESILTKTFSQMISTCTAEKRGDKGFVKSQGMDGLQH